MRRYLQEDEVHSFLAALAREAKWVEPDVEISECRDPKDNKFLELAVTGSATHIITGDSDLLMLNPFRSIQIVTPHSFLVSL